MTAKTVLITGASDGIGACAARQLAAQGHRVLVVGRDPAKTAAVAGAVGARSLTADFTELAQVRALADQVRTELDGQPLDVLANNAGGIFGAREPTVDGFEKTFQVNHLAPFLLTHLLLEELLDGGGAVVNTSSMANRLFGRLDLAQVATTRTASANRAYGDAKLANILFARGLHARFHDRGLAAVAFHPGVVATSFASDTSSMMRLFYRSPIGRRTMITAEQGGANLAWFAAGTPDVTWQSGAYYDQRTASTKVNPQANDDALVDALWTASAAMTGTGAP